MTSKHDELPMTREQFRAAIYKIMTNPVHRGRIKSIVKQAGYERLSDIPSTQYKIILDTFELYQRGLKR